VSTQRASLRSASWISLWSLVQLVVQFLFQVLLARYFGASAEMDAYLAAIALPTVLCSIVAGPLSFALVPVFSESLQRGDAPQAWRSASRIGTWLMTFSVPVCVLISFFAEPLTSWLSPGFRGLRHQLTVELLPIFGWLVLTNLALAYLQALYHCCQRFLLPAISPVISTLVTLLLALWIQPGDVRSVALAVMGGAVVGVALHLPLVVRHLRPSWHVDGMVRQSATMLLPLIAGALYFRLDPLVDRYLASSLETGSLSHMGFAWRFATALVVVGTSGLSIVVFPSLSLLWKQGKLPQFQSDVALAMRCLCVILIPMVVAVSVYGQPLISDLLERGEFHAADALAVSQLLTLYLGMIVAAGFGEVTAKVFYAMGDTRTPVLVGTAGFTIGIALKFWLTPSIGVTGIVLATSVYRLLNICTMSMLLTVRLGRSAYAGLVRALLRGTVAAVAAVVAAFPVVHSALPLPTLWGAAVGLVAYLIAMALLGDELAATIWRRLRTAKEPAVDDQQAEEADAVQPWHKTPEL
jgi:putative peptidoglycan lipid II flippase